MLQPLKERHGFPNVRITIGSLKVPQKREAVTCLGASAPQTAHSCQEWPQTLKNRLVN